MKIDIKQPNLAEYQKKILQSKKRFTITEASTKVGKTFSHMWWLFQEAHKQPQPKNGANYWWVAPVYEQAEIAFKRIVSKVQKNKYYIINHSKLSITTPVNSIIRFKSADNPDNLYGEDVFAAVFDEFTRAKYDSWVALRSTLTYTNGKCKLIGNFTGIANWGHQLAEKAKEYNSEYEYFKVTAWDAVNEGILKKEEIEQAQKDLPPPVFAALYLAEALEEQNQLIKNNKIIDLFTNNCSKGHKYITADVAFTNDFFCFLVWDGFNVIDYFYKSNIDAKTLCDILNEYEKKYLVPRSNIIYNSDGLGEYLKSYLPGAVGINNGMKSPYPDYANIKDCFYYYLADHVNNNKLAITCDVDIVFKQKLISQFQMIKMSSDIGNKLKVLSKHEIKQCIGESPDISEAFIYRMFGIIYRKC